MAEVLTKEEKYIEDQLKHHNFTEWIIIITFHKAEGKPWGRYSRDFISKYSGYLIFMDIRLTWPEREYLVSVIGRDSRKINSAKVLYQSKTLAPVIKRAAEYMRETA